MGRPRTRPTRYYLATDSFAGEYPDTHEAYFFHKGQLVSEQTVKRLGKQYFEPADKGVEIEGDDEPRR